MAAATCGVIAACVGDEPNRSKMVGEDAGGAAGEDAEARGIPNRDAETSGPLDGGADADAGSRCGERDRSPCGCAGISSCCVVGNEGRCAERGNEEMDAATGCTSTNTIRCVASTCGGNRVCCFNGTVTGGSLCPKRMTAFDTECLDVNPDGGYPCVDTSNGVTKPMLCLVDADCELFDAGRCESALMDSVDRIMGICVR